MKTGYTNWDEALISRFRQLYHEGLSFAIIAQNIGCTRNAAIGKAHRLNFEPRDSCINRRPGPKPGSPSRPRKIRVTRQFERRFSPPEEPTPTVSAAVERFIDPDYDYRCSINDLDDHSCRFPLWDRDTPHSQRLYCGRPSADLLADAPYCPSHAEICAPKN